MVHQLPSLLAVGAVLSLGAPGLGQPVRVDHGESRKLLVLDPRVVEKAEGLRLVPGAVEKDPHNPLLPADQPWENALNNLYPNIVYDQAEGLFKLWYKCVLFDKDVIARMTPPRTVHDVGWFLCYATSRDGVVWKKPQLDVVRFAGVDRNNIVARDVANVGVFKDDHDPDAKRRFKMIYDIGPGNMRVRFSADGLHWSDEIIPEGLGKVGDTHNNAFWDPRLGKYVLITRKFLGERLVYRSESTDFLKWREPTLALRSTAEEGKNVQAYCMPAFPYAQGYLGWAMMYNVKAGRTVDCELVWSPDSVQWRRVFPGKPFLPRGPRGTYDSACIYAQAGPPILQGGRLLVFYGGSAAPHAGWKRHCFLSLARLRVDGFACYEPEKEGQPGVLTTRPLRCTGEDLRLNVDARSGSVWVALLDRSGKCLMEGEPLTGDLTDGLVRWKNNGKLAGFKGQTVQLRIELHGARFYALRGLELPARGR